MQVHARKLLVIIAESSLEKDLIQDAREHGAQGYTIGEVRGGGHGGAREARWEADRSIEMKVVCSEAVALALGQHVLDRYAPHYAVTMFVTDVGVFRPQKY